jgi:hypothetical protein
MSVEGRAFLSLFREHVNPSLASLPNIHVSWDSAREWTDIMLGSSRTRAVQDHGLIGKVGKSLGYSIQAEYFRVDQVWYSSSKTDADDWIIEAFIEHENEISRVPETIRKILQLGSGLKVLVTYPERTDVEKIVRRVSDQIKSRYGTAPDSRLLLVFGRLANALPIWSAYEFDGLGRVVELP